MADDEPSQFSIMGNFLPEHVLGYIVLLVVEQVFLNYAPSTRHLCSCFKQPSRALMAFDMTWKNDRLVLTSSSYLLILSSIFYSEATARRFMK